MTHQNEGHYAAKHPPGTALDPKICEALEKKQANGKITCAAAHSVADDLGLSPAEIGVALDLLEIRIHRCQLGLYGYSPEKKIVKPAGDVSPALKDAIEQAMAGDRISCLSCWRVAKNLNIGKMDVSAACECLNIKISPCQLGAFR
ncbi:MAG: hypothetical protein JXD19_00025 [Deltaproteobacteria bacterium]|nr:hypothetical protein [Deltaproteobacteria bacterium]